MIGGAAADISAHALADFVIGKFGGRIAEVFSNEADLATFCLVEKSDGVTSWKRDIKGRMPLVKGVVEIDAPIDFVADVIADWRLELDEVITGDDPDVMVALQRFVGRMTRGESLTLGDADRQPRRFEN